MTLVNRSSLLLHGSVAVFELSWNRLCCEVWRARSSLYRKGIYHVQRRLVLYAAEGTRVEPWGQPLPPVMSHQTEMKISDWTGHKMTQLLRQCLLSTTRNDKCPWSRGPQLVYGIPGNVTRKYYKKKNAFASCRDHGIVFVLNFHLHLVSVRGCCATPVWTSARWVPGGRRSHSRPPIKQYAHRR